MRLKEARAAFADAERNGDLSMKTVTGNLKPQGGDEDTRSEGRAAALLNLLHHGAFDTNAEPKDDENRETATKVVESVERAFKHDQPFPLTIQLPPPQTANSFPTTGRCACESCVLGSCAQVSSSHFKL